MVRTVVGSPFVLALLAAAVAAQKQPSTIVAAFARAGSNRAELAQALIDHLAAAYFRHYAVFAYVVDAQIARREKYL